MKSVSALVVLAVIAVAVFITCTFSVPQWNQALVLEFGQVKRIENAWRDKPNAGLKWKKPWEKVVLLERRNLLIDLRPVELLASDQKPMLVDAFVRYRIVDGVKFYESLRSEDTARVKLESIMDSTLRDVLGRVSTTDIISGKREALMQEIKKVTNATANAPENDFGIEIIDVRIKRADLPPANAKGVFKRMITERNQRAAQIRAEGEKRAREIKATADKQAAIIKAKAQEQSEIIKGQGDSARIKIFAEAYNLDPEFAKFYLTMQAYEKGLKNKTSYVLSPDSDFLSYLSNQHGKK